MRNTKKLTVLMLVALAMSSFGFDFFAPETWFGSKTFDIVQDGKPVAEIVLAEGANPSQKLAAADLVEFFGKMSGAKVAVVPAPTGKVENVIYVGESEFTGKLGFDLKGVEDGGYKLVVKDHYAIVAGRDLLLKLTQYNKRSSDPNALENQNALKKWHDLAGEKFGKENLCPAAWWYLDLQKNPICPEDDTGTWYAASELLQQLGVRFYAPDENGTVVPRREDIALKEQELVGKPHALVRSFSGHPSFETVKWYKRMKCGNSIQIVSMHTICDIMDRDVIEKYPSIQAMNKDGKPVGNYCGMSIPKFSDPTFLKLSVKYLDAMFRAYPECGAELYACSLGPPDGMDKTDYQDRLKFPKGSKITPGMIYPPDMDSDYLWDYWHRAAKELKKIRPDKKLACFAYGYYAEPPKDTALVENNTVIHHVYTGQAMTENDIHHKCFLETQAAWLKLVTPSRYYIWNHYLFYWGDAPPYPHFFTKALQDDAKRVEDSLGRFIEVCYVVPKGERQHLLNPALMHFTLYWQSVLFWNPDADCEETMDEYFKLYFGPAEKEMREFYLLAEKRTDEARLPLNKHTEKSLADYHEGYFSLLREAQAQCAEDSVYAKRVAQFEGEMAPLKLIPPTLNRCGPEIHRGTVEKSAPDADYANFRARQMRMKDNLTGKDVAVNFTNAKIGLARDKKTLYVIAECFDNDMAGITAACAKNNENAIFSDDVVEIFVATPARSFFHVVVNPNGAVWDESTDPGIVQRDTLPLLWDPGAKAAVRKLGDRWIVEAAIPANDFGELGPSDGFPWWIQIARTRVRGGKQTHQAVAPTGAGYAKFQKWGKMK